MPKVNTIYTIGIEQMPFNSFLIYIQQYGINCIVDAREASYINSTGQFNSNTLEQELKNRRIAYLAFTEEFGFIPADARNKYGSPLYSKVCKLNSFQRGFERLTHGAEKGYTIAIIVHDAPSAVSLRFSILGKHLSSMGFEVRHIMPNGMFNTQDIIEEQNKRQKQRTKELKDKAADVGRNGEELAALYLSRNGYAILDHNWNLHRGCELDLVARKDGILHFIEVKTRSNGMRGNPKEAIDRKKMDNIFKALRAYISRNMLQDMPFQVDSIAIIYKDEDNYDLEMTENIFYQKRKVY